MKKSVEIYTDGACSGNPGPGGWGALMIYGNSQKIISGYELATTNNQMELTACIEALKILKEPCNIKLYTDSKYVQQGITSWIHNWQKKNWLKSDNKPVKNAQLWQLLQSYSQKHDIIWEWVKGHGDNEGNIIADEAAVLARDEAVRVISNSS